jgi:hypothetical protein
MVAGWSWISSFIILSLFMLQEILEWGCACRKKDAPGVAAAAVRVV